MAAYNEVLPSKLYAVLVKAGISTPLEVLSKSVWDIKKKTNLKSEDIGLLKSITSDFVLNGRNINRGDTLLKIENRKVTTGCLHLDDCLRGGFRRGTITEIFGESGSGKTQLCLHSGIHNWDSGAVYICTEDQFPVKRFEQIVQSLPDYNPKVNYGNKIFVEHLSEPRDLLSCIKVRLPKLLDAHGISLVIVDSIAALFRSEYTNYIRRAHDLKEVAMTLIKIAKTYDVAVICINQVSSNFDTSTDVIPCLGLAWSNMISTRISIKKTETYIDLGGNFIKSDNEQCPNDCVQLRELSVVFSPELPNLKLHFIVTQVGVKYVS